eukprot:TRINITY_DN27777_c0_g1_i1.p1 TRINITY_DN27777_c0_g1~~TRINITY_DN27777_c0_g1_i1.p1  ORF type:complete len:608 (+),score=163.38 TRINITY_DN27777_c0_g1_i1:25-1848(+)
MWKASTDGTWDGFSSPRSKLPPPTSMHIKMKDSVRLAADLYLPQTVPYAKYPCIVHFTRYYRSWKVKWPVSVALGDSYTTLQNIIEYFLPAGYAWLSVDVRGTGASFGRKGFDFCSQEQEDFVSVLDWVGQQSWSDGNIGCLGYLYDGLAALYAGAIGHPSLKAIAPLFIPADLLVDLISPGGIPCTGFTEAYTNYIKALDCNLPGNNFLLPYTMQMAVDGVFPVAGSTFLRSQAIKEHTENNNDTTYQALSQAMYRDDIIDFEEEKLTMYAYNPIRLCDQLNKASLPIYFFAGYYDGASVNSALKYYNKITRGNVRLTIGPWKAGGRVNGSPHTSSTTPAFQIGLELVRFFNCHLKGNNSQFMDEPPLHYFNVGEECWKEDSKWPHVQTEKMKMYLEEDGLLDMEHNEFRTSFKAVEYKVDLQTKSANNSRWSFKNQNEPLDYFAFEPTNNILRYSSAPLKDKISITGHPILQLEFMCDKKDATIFVYLTEYNKAENKHYYVTEGMLRALHRYETTDEFRVEIPGVPYKSFKRENAKDLKRKTQTLISIHLHPISYTFKKGNSICLTLTGADIGNFNNENLEDYKNPTWWKIFCNSRLEIPLQNQT